MTNDETRHESNHEWLADHIDLYAIDALPVDESDEVEAQLDMLAPTARAEYETQVADLRNLMHDYGRRYTHEAPDALRARVLADFDANIGRTGPTPLHTRRRRRIAVAVGAAAASIAVLFGAGVLVGRTTVPESSTNVQAEAAAAVFGAQDATISVGDLDGARGVLTVVSSKSRNQAVATLRDVRNPVPDDRALQLWMVGKQEQPVSAGLFAGEDSTPILVDALDSTSAFAITVEPRGGSTGPTTPLLTQVKV
ncbi:anti-sigma factor [Gordonia liuliyuniae]|uniref:Regulator of SigK n=1 Tax=Gordonia liuliyuniae TaxID=2911517 RepID=A0ABS9ISH4_9ACTN|nr:anti-sigma factor [Gordonia liuliyuniae]MCF8588498.1 anti-sigma factor [Gordonia liuliyuniae]